MIDISPAIVLENTTTLLIVTQVATLAIVELVISFFALLAAGDRMLSKNVHKLQFSNIVECIALIADILLGIISVAVFTVPALNKFDELMMSMDGSADEGAVQESGIVPCLATCVGSVLQSLGLAGDPVQHPW